MDYLDLSCDLEDLCLNDPEINAKEVLNNITLYPDSHLNVPIRSKIFECYIMFTKGLPQFTKLP